MWFRWVRYLLPSLFLIGSLVLIYAIQTDTLIQLLACKPKNWTYFYTAFTGPFLHGDSLHLWGNVSSLFGLSLLFIWLFPYDWIRFFLFQWILSSIGLFLLGDLGESHIGASTWVYSFAAFLAYFTWRNKHRNMNAMLFILVLWYGSMWWGLLPLLPRVSHEGHIAGLVVGVLIGHFGFYYWEQRLMPEWKQTPKTWEYEEEPKNPYL